MAKEKAKAKGEFMREVIRQYIKRDRRWKQLRKWGKETVKGLVLEDEGVVVVELRGYE